MYIDKIERSTFVWDLNLYKIYIKVILTDVWE